MGVKAVEVYIGHEELTTLGSINPMASVVGVPKVVQLQSGQASQCFGCWEGASPVRRTNPHS